MRQIASFVTFLHTLIVTHPHKINHVAPKMVRRVFYTERAFQEVYNDI